MCNILASFYILQIRFRVWWWLRALVVRTSGEASGLSREGRTCVGKVNVCISGGLTLLHSNKVHGEASARVLEKELDRE